MKNILKEYYDTKNNHAANATIQDLNTGYYPFNEGRVYINDDNTLDYHITFVNSTMIDDVKSDNEELFSKLMKSLVSFCKKKNVELIYFANNMTEELHKWFVNSGFEDENVFDEFNHYMHLKIGGDIT